MGLVAKMDTHYTLAVQTSKSFKMCYLQKTLHVSFSTSANPSDQNKHDQKSAACQWRLWMGNYGEWKVVIYSPTLSQQQQLQWRRARDELKL